MTLPFPAAGLRATLTAALLATLSTTSQAVVTATPNAVDLGTIEVGDYPEGIEATRDGKAIYVANWFSNTMSRVDPLAMKVIGEIETGDGPRSFGDFIRD